MERSIVGLTAAMVHYFRRPPHSISPRKEAGKGGPCRSGFQANGELAIPRLSSRKTGACPPLPASLRGEGRGGLAALPIAFPRNRCAIFRINLSNFPSVNRNSC